MKSDELFYTSLRSTANWRFIGTGDPFDVTNWVDGSAWSACVIRSFESGTLWAGERARREAGEGGAVFVRKSEVARA